MAEKSVTLQNLEWNTIENMMGKWNKVFKII